jgi:hypothetical protein
VLISVEARCISNSPQEKLQDASIALIQIVAVPSLEPLQPAASSCPGTVKCVISVLYWYRALSRY